VGGISLGTVDCLAVHRCQGLLLMRRDEAGTVQASERQEIAVLADDHNVVRDGLKRVLEEVGVHVVAEASDGLTAVELVLRHRPDLILMDVSMPVMGGIDATTRIRRSWPDAPILLLSMYGEERIQREAAKAGAAGYLVKDCSRAELIAAVQRVMAGQVLEPQGGPLEDDERRPAAELTSRQADILQRLADGDRPKQIARDLRISVRTVNNHLAAAYRNLGVSNRLEAVLEASRLGYIEINGNGVGFG
jgi:two-component system response regulator NreC